MKKFLAVAFLLTFFSSYSQIPAYVPTNGLVAYYPFNGNANDESGNGNNGTVYGGVSLTTDKDGYNNKAYDWPTSGASSNYIDIPDITHFFTNSFTLTAWIYMDGGSMDPRVISKGEMGVIANGSSNTSRTFRCYWDPGGLGFSPTNPVPAKQWVHIAFTADGNGGYSRFYVNGEILNEGCCGQTTGSWPTGLWNIGRKSIGAYDSWGGKLDDIAIYNRVLTQQEITQLYTNSTSNNCVANILNNDTTICSGSSIDLTLNTPITNGSDSNCFSPKVVGISNTSFGLNATCKDNNGNIFVTGAYTGNTNFGNVTLSGIGGRDVFLAKYNSCGVQQWALRGGSSGNEDYSGVGTKSIATDTSGNIFIVGRYNQTFTFYGNNSTSFVAPYTATSNGNHQDGYLIKINSNGEILWGATLRGGSNDGFNGVAVDNAGNPIVTGGFNGCCPSTFAVTIFGPYGSLGVSSFGINYGSGLVVKFDANGNIIWKAAVYNRDTDLNRIAIDGSNNIYLVSAFRSWSNGTAGQFIDANGTNNSLFNPGIGLGFLVKLNSTGIWQWGVTYGNSGDGVGSLTYGTDISLDNNENPWISGFYRGAAATFYTTSGSTLSLPSSTNDIGFIAKYNAAGVPQLVNSLQQSTGNTYFNGIAIANDTIAIAGHFTGNNLGSNDILLAKYNVDAVLQSVKTGGGPGDDQANSVVANGTGFIVSGTIGGASNIDGVSLNSAGTFLWNIYSDRGNSNSYLWSNGSNNSSITVSPTQTTTYSVTVDNGTTSCSDSVTVTVNNLNPNLFSQDTIRACGTSYTLDASEGYANYSWNTGATSSSINVSTTGWYKCTVTNNGCNGEDSVFVSIVDANILNNDTAICIRNSIMLTLQNNLNSTGFKLITGGDCYSILKMDNSNYFISTRTTVLISSVLDGVWTSANWPLGIVRSNTSIVGTMERQGNRFFVASLDNGNYFSSNLGQSFQGTGVTGFGCASSAMKTLANGDCLMTMGGFQRGIYKISSNSNSWVLKFTLNPDFNDFAIDNNGKIYSPAQSPNHPGGLYRSADNGETWANIWSTSYYENPCVLDCFNDSIYLCTNNGKIFKSSTNNTTLGLVSDNFGSIGYPGDLFIDNDGTFYLTSSNYSSSSVSSIAGFYISKNKGVTWQRYTINGASNYYKINKVDNRIFIGTDIGMMEFVASESYLWSTGAATSSIIVTPTQTTTYYATISNGISSCTDSVTVYVIQPSTNTTDISSCNSYEWNGQTYTQSGTYTWVGSNVSGCDSTVILNLTINNSTSYSEDVTACGVYNWNGIDYTNSGVYTFTTTNAVGCDSVATLNLTVIFSTSSTEDVTACDTYTWNDNTYTQSGVYTYTTLNTAGCDSTATLNLNINFSTSSTEDVTACDTYSWNGVDYTNSGVYTFNTTNSKGCDSTATLNLTITQLNPNLFTQDTIRTCGTAYYLIAETGFNSYLWNNGEITQSIVVGSTGLYTCTVSNETCTSKDSVFVSILNANILNNDTTICNGNQVTLNCFVQSSPSSNLIFSPGSNYEYSFPPVSDDWNLNIGGWSSGNAPFGNVSNGADGSNDFNYATYWPADGADGDDLFVRRKINFTGYDLSSINYQLGIDNGYKLYVNGHLIASVNEEGYTYRWEYSGQIPAAYLNQGDNIIAVALEDHGGLTAFDMQITGNPIATTNSILWSNGQSTPSITVTPNQTTTYYCTVANGYSNCTDSVTVYVNQPTSSIADVTACDTYTWNGLEYTNSGVYTFNTVNAVGCDSTVTLNLTINNSTTSTEDVTACDSYNWNGNTYTQSGIYTYTTLNTNGCDSTATLYLTFNYSSSSTQDVTACDTYNWNGIDYTNSGVYTFNTTNIKGCDSIATLNLTVNYSTSSIADVTACDTYTWNGVEYTNSGVYTFNTVNAVGCDSTVTLNLTITPNISNTTSASSCDSYTWNVNNQTYTQSGTFVYLNECATDTLVLTITPSTRNTTTASACDSYTWIVNNQTYTQSGTYVYINGCSTDSLVLTITPSTSNTTTASACDSYTWIVNNQTYTQSGTYVYVNGCATDTLVLTITPSSSNTTTASACTSYTWIANGQTYTQSGTYISVNGCRTEILNLTINRNSTAASSINTNVNNITAGASVNLNVVGGSLGTGASWKWYTTSCGGTPIGTGSSITVTPNVTTTYFVRAEGTCNNTTCVSVTINVQAVNPCGPTGVISNVSGNIACNGNSIRLTVQGTLNSGASWRWYKGGCGSGSCIGSGSSITVTPSSSTTYFVRSEGDTCGTSTCKSITISVGNKPSTPGSITASSSLICNQSGIRYSISNVSGATSYNWTVPSGATIVSGQGTTSITVNYGSAISLNPSCGSVSVCVRAINACGSSDQKCLDVSTTPIGDLSISGTSTPCKGYPTTYTCNSITGATTYTWTVPSGYTILSGQGSRTVSVKAGSVQGQIRVVATNACGAGSTASRTLKPKSCIGSTFTRNNPSEETNLDLIVWPIPANQEIHLETIGFKADQLEIVGSQGQMVTKSNWKSTLHVGHLPSGTYFIKATGKERVMTHKIQIIH